MSIQKKESKATGSGTTRLGVTAVLAVVAFASASSVHAATAAKDADTDELRAPTAEEFTVLEKQRVKTNAAMTVVKDPVTGELRAPTAEEFSTLERLKVKEKTTQQKLPNGKSALVAAKPAEAGDGEIRLPDGSVGMQLGEEHMAYSVMTRNADGTMTLHCVTGSESANKLIKAPQSSTAKTNNIDKEHGHAHK